jgi:hypothetical protein
MARPKKDSIALNIRAEKKIMLRFQTYCDEVGQPKTVAWERIVSAFLDDYYKDKEENKSKK